MSWYWTIVLFLLSLTTVQAQSAEQTPNGGRAFLPHINYGLHIPSNDWSDRYGQHNSLSAGLDFLSRNDWLIGVEGSFLFGQRVKEDVLSILRTDEGYIIGNDRNPADIVLRMRGFYIGGHIGKLIPLSKNNPRSGLRLQAGAGLLQHQIRIQRDPMRTVNQLAGDYVKGYDRLSNGFALRQLIAYQYMSLDRRLNLYIGLDLMQGFTQSRRDLDFDIGRKDEESYLDVNIGLRAGLILPIFLISKDEVIYY